MAPNDNPQVGEKEFVVRRGRVGSVDLYEIKENELELIEQGSPASLQLNFAIFLLSIAFSSILALATTTVKWPIMETVLVVIAVAGILLGIYLLFSWWRTRKSIVSLAETIRERIPPESTHTSSETAKESSSMDDEIPSG